MEKVVLVNPSMATVGYSFITPRWLYVIAQATPVELLGDPVIVDETINRFDPSIINPGDIVGIGISTGNCTAGYRVLREAKLRGATVIVGGIHATIFPDEPLEMGADAVVTGSGDVVWPTAIRDALDGRLKRQYVGGRVPGDALLKARWDLLDPTKYLLASVQTVAGCPENCSFCSVWVTDGRRPRQRLTEKIIEEVNELYQLGFRYIVFADDNFNPATLGRIAREPNLRKRKELEQIREERLLFFDEYDRLAKHKPMAFTQMTTEVISDSEYLSAMYEKMRIRTALVGVESFTEEGLERAGKQWNPAGEKMIETIQQIQASGILVLSSIICGLESDTATSIETMNKFARASGSTLAQFTMYVPYPGTKDYYQLMKERNGAASPVKNRTEILYDRFWLTPGTPVDWIKHPNMSREELLRVNQKCWSDFYALSEVIKRARFGVARSWPLAGKVTYVLLCMVFKRVYAGHGMSADSVQRQKGFATRALIKMATGVFALFFRKEKMRFRVFRRRNKR